MERNMEFPKRPLTAHVIEFTVGDAEYGYNVPEEYLLDVIADHVWVQKSYARMFAWELFNARAVPGHLRSSDVVSMERLGREYYIHVCRFASDEDRLKFPRSFLANPYERKGAKVHAAFDYHLAFDSRVLDRVMVYLIPAFVLRCLDTSFGQVGESLSVKRFERLLHERFDISVAKYHNHDDRREENTRSGKTSSVAMLCLNR